MENVSGGFVAAAGEVEISDPTLIQNAECIDALGGEIDASGRSRAGDKENMLAGDEIAKLRRQLVMKSGHSIFLTL
jgi:hypothetical protein